MLMTWEWTGCCSPESTAREWHIQGKQEVTTMQTEELIHELPKGLIKWYDFQSGSRALYLAVDEEDTLLAEALTECGLRTERMSVRELDDLVRDGQKLTPDLYEYIVIAGALERSRAPEAGLCVLRESLTPTGRLLLGADNRLGIRYFCGDRDAFTDRNFDSIENYARITASDSAQLGGHAYAKAELEKMLMGAGFTKYRFYSVLPNLSRPQILFAEDYLPEEELDVRIFPQYNYPDTVFLEEERLYTTLIENGLFHAMANGYLIECSQDGSFAGVKQITASMERGKVHAMFTVIRRDGKVEKRAVYEEGRRKLEQLLENTVYLQKQGVRMIDAAIEGEAFVMPYVQGEPLTEYFRRLLGTDLELFYAEMDRLWEVILRSSEHVPYEEINWEQFEPGWEKRKADDPGKEKWRRVAFGTQQEQNNLGVILKRGYIDLICLNGFYTEDGFVFYDQEIYVDNLPAKAILLRTIQMIYRGNQQLEQFLTMNELMERYQLYEYRELFGKFTSRFLNDLRNDKELASYYRMYRRDTGVIHSNRQRLNYSTAEYERLFRDIFKGTEGRTLYLFGSGNFTKKFLSQFGNDYEIAGILDNNRDKWGTEMSGLPVMTPEILLKLPEGSYKVIICIKNFVPVVRQLRELGVKEFGIFDDNLTYPRKQIRAVQEAREKAETPKKYHVGYIAGVFDLFHVGHLNMFKRAKEQCDYLIVGVVSDESVMKNKKTMPYVPFEERIEMVRSCRYVDEAVAIPTEYGNTDEAYRRYQFDVQFSGSDYADDPVWLAKRTFLQKQGSDMVFFPYTQSTSSTKLKALIEKNLL